MKITCQSCQAKYTIADEKVAGKTVKIKCKKCGATIVVHGNEGAVAAAPAAAAPDPSVGAGAPHGGGEDEDEGDGATRVFGNEGGPGQVDEWTINVTDDDQRTLTPAQILVEFQRGVITTDSYVWKDGMPDWLPLSAVPELMKVVGAKPAPAAGRPVAAPAPAVSPEVALGGTVMMAEAPRVAISPAAAPAPAAPAAPVETAPAARRAGGRAGAVDLFATSEASPRVDPHAAAPAPAAHSATTSADRLVGERNENSVLFSLSALTATENLARAKKELSDEAVIDLGPSPAAASKGGGRSGIDDIMNLGGGGISAGPMLAPPPLLAPVVEAPVAAPAIAPVIGVGAGPVMMPGAAPPKKGSLGLILGIVAGLVVVGGVGAFFALKGNPTPPPPVTNERGATTVAEAPSAAPSATPVDTGAVAVPTPTPVDTGATPTTPPTPSGAALAVTAKPTATVAPTGKPGDKPPPEKTTAPTATQAPTAAPDPGGGGKEFDRAAAMSALSKAAGAAKSCKKDDGPTGSGKVKVTFAPSGNVTSATVEGPPFAGTAVGGCVAAAFRGARVPPFDGTPISVSKSFTIN
jgi:predicted Zn finger-like uncharacterized protein